MYKMYAQKAENTWTSSWTLTTTTRVSIPCRHMDSVVLRWSTVDCHTSWLPLQTAEMTHGYTAADPCQGLAVIGLGMSPLYMTPVDNEHQTLSTSASFSWEKLKLTVFNQSLAFKKLKTNQPVNQFTDLKTGLRRHCSTEIFIKKWLLIITHLRWTLRISPTFIFIQPSPSWVCIKIQQISGKWNSISNYTF